MYGSKLVLSPICRIDGGLSMQPLPGNCDNSTVHGFLKEVSGHTLDREDAGKGG